MGYAGGKKDFAPVGRMTMLIRNSLKTRLLGSQIRLEC